MLIELEKRAKQDIHDQSQQKIYNIEKIKTNILAIDEFIQIWDLCIELDNDDSGIAITNKADILDHIIIEYLTLRGYAYTARFMEHYKYNNKKNLKKSKGLRSTLAANVEE